MRITPASRHHAGWLPQGRRTQCVVALLTAGLLLSGCASADKNQQASAGTGGSSSDSRMAGMNMGSTFATSVPEVDGQKPVPAQTLATAAWQGMETRAQTRTPA